MDLHQWTLATCSANSRTNSRIMGGRRKMEMRTGARGICGATLKRPHGAKRGHGKKKTSMASKMQSAMVVAEKVT